MTSVARDDDRTRVSGEVRRSGGRAAAAARLLVTPPALLLLPVLLSLVAWLVPVDVEEARGFLQRASLTTEAVAVLASWYATMLGAGALGWIVGRRVPLWRTLDAASDRLYYYSLTVLAAVGVGWSYGRAVIPDPDAAWFAIRTQQFNLLRQGLEYAPGVHTLRYAAILSGGIACYELFLRRRFGWVHAVNVAVLLAAAALSSRLSLVMATLVVVALYGYRSRRDAPPLRGALAFVVVLVVAFVTFNYVRNAGYYALYGIDDPISSTLYEAAAYLGTPFQASVGVAARARSDEDDPAPVRTLQLNGDAEAGVDHWHSWTRVSPVPALSTTEDEHLVRSGERALLVRMRNSTGRPADHFVYGSPVEVEAGDRYLLRAFVSGPASARYPVRLGYRVAEGSGAGGITQYGLRLPDVTKSADGGRWLEGVYEVTSDVTVLELAVWRTIPARSATWFAVDSAVVARVGDEPPGGGRPPLADAIRRYVAPTYLAGDYSAVIERESSYREYVDVAPNLSTNSAFVAMYLALGALAFPLAAVIGFAAALIAGHASKYGSYFVLATVVAAYGFAEFWRVYLFNAGIIHFLLLALVALPLLAAAARRVWRRGLAARAQRAGER